MTGWANMEGNQRLIFIAHPRSGSSSLYQILQLHPSLNILEEPFNEGFAEWSPNGKTYLDKIVDIPSFDEQLADIFSEYNGLKMLNYQLDDDVLAYLLEKKDLFFIFLRRRNILQSVVSTMIADQTGLWKMWEMNRTFGEYYKQLKPLNISEIQSDTQEIEKQLDNIERRLDNRPKGTVLKFVYEDLYFTALEQRKRQIEVIWPFLKLSPLRDERVEYYLLPEKVKINSLETYRMLPNCQEIEEKCGNDRTGWLFKG
jgi:hypothetical protein